MKGCLLRYVNQPTERINMFSMKAMQANATISEFIEMVENLGSAAKETTPDYDVAPLLQFLKVAQASYVFQVNMAEMFAEIEKSQGDGNP